MNTWLGGALYCTTIGLLTIATPIWAPAAEESGPSTDSLLDMMERARDDVQTLRSEQLFLASCTQCHDAERASSARKTHDEWVMTVRRMAAKPGANIPESQIDPIIDYLASLRPVEETAVNEGREVPTVSEVLAASDVSVNATVSLLWRKGDAQVENEGFFPDVWFGAEWNPENSPLSARVMACTTCHDDGSQGMNIELVEGSFRADLLHMISGERAAERDSDVSLEAEAGRFSVPFGAYSGMAHPGVYRTVTYPLMYNMGRRVGYYEPVLPMPYADEGAGLKLGVPLPADFVLQLDGYAVNGLQEGGFYPSRSWRDNNSDVALGGRATVGNAWVVFGGSYCEGESQNTGSPGIDYHLLGCDATLRYRQYVRAYYEYARREEDAASSSANRFSGYVAELEAMVWHQPKITLLVRYDTVKNPGNTVERMTWGPGLLLPGGSLLMINQERWKHESVFDDEDIIGVRWVASF